MSLQTENYFTCNLGQAASYGTDSEFTNINDFLHRIAHDYPFLPALGYFPPLSSSSSSLHPTILTFQEIHHQSHIFADSIISSYDIPRGHVVALIMVRSSSKNLFSTLDFLCAFLALMELGFSVLLIAPQCRGKGLVGLCKRCEASVVWVGDYDEDEEDQGEMKGEMKGLEEAAGEIDFELKSYVLDVRKSLVGMREGSFSSFPPATPEASPPPPATLEVSSSPPPATPKDTAYLFHTSGTSTGTPKPIPQTHRAGAGVQHHFDGTQSATFTTTPLYHGAMADLFRAWTSHAMIWFFPGEHLPITQKNVVKCLEAANMASSTNHGVPPVKYFSSVPYVLQSMSSESDSLRLLQKMDIVGVGGAALPTEVGDELVRKGVKLISRFGSAECGFLMSSHRDYECDGEWQYLRPGEEALVHFRFEAREDEDDEDGLYELIVLPTWPFLATSNREDGSFATSDLFQPHPRMPNAWKYHSRADSQLTLITGKKFDPSPIESSLGASSPWIADVLVFGNDRPFPGALVFRSRESEDVSDERLIDEVWPMMEKLNADGQTHTRISRDMLFPMPFVEEEEGGGLEKSSKGSILRRRAEERYQQYIHRAYSSYTTTHSIEIREIHDGEVVEHVRNIVQSFIRHSHTIDDSADLFVQGVDSIASIQIRSKLRSLLPKDAGPLPATIVEDCGTIVGISEAIIDLRRGKKEKKKKKDESEMMEQLVSEYSILDPIPEISPESALKRPLQEKKTILLTGSTGSLGCNLLFQLLSSTQVKHIHLLIRGGSHHEASQHSHQETSKHSHQEASQHSHQEASQHSHQETSQHSHQETSKHRLKEVFTSRRLEFPPDFDSQVSIHPYNIHEPRLGLNDSTYESLVQEVDLIIHLAWSVNFLIPLTGFLPHISALRTLLTLASSHSQYTPDNNKKKTGSRFIFCSSTASISSSSTSTSPPSSTHPTPEKILPPNPHLSSNPIAYSLSKWIAEQICSRVSLSHPSLQGRIDVVRLGQVSGHSQTGVWNPTEAYPLLLSTVKWIGCLPRLEGENLAWIPVDVAARGFVELALNDTTTIKGRRMVVESPRVFHLLNPRAKTPWNVILQWLREEGGEKFEIVSVEEWLGKLEGLVDDFTIGGGIPPPCLKLLHFWREAYGGGGKKDDGGGVVDDGCGCEFAMGEFTRECMPVLTSLKSLEREYVMKIWDWVKVSV